MSRKRERKTPKWQWEQALIGDYSEHRGRQVLDPLYEKFQCWRAGELSHGDMDQAIHEVHKQNQATYTLFRQDRGFVLSLIVSDRGWFDAWAAEHSPPSGVKQAYPWAFATAGDRVTLWCPGSRL